MHEGTSGLGTVSRGPRLVDEVVAKLREGIVTGRLAPGTQLLQVDLARELGVSRTPLREAFRVLENDGLVRISNNNRTVEVVAITARDIREMYELREVLDGLASRLAAERGFTRGEEQHAYDLLRALDESRVHYDPVRRTEAHTNFHQFVARASGNGRFEMFMDLIRTSSAALHQPFVTDPEAVQLVRGKEQLNFSEVMAKSDEQHREILEAIIARDGQTAETAARRHVQRTIQHAADVDFWRKLITARSEEL
ncbi:GntR family transcriptional regulator [Mycolicibacterium vinylchloridicum]|uniref:GntR family transcriptional regulator n=1 Tax=Mycolicibacterium vinylchloridicum TaxID=2736928 RepID=UPI0015C7871C|nr:GntR family transcriptional regulator [Mycolicibacterium vinylchloridicum]